MFRLTDTITLYSREDWGARKPQSPMVTEGQMRPREAFLHHTTDPTAERVDTLPEQKAAMRGIQAFHMNTRGYSDISYHYVVFQPYGAREYARIFEGRLSKFVPAAQLNHNTGTIAIAVYGNFDHDDVVKSNTRHAIAVLLRKRNLTVLTLGGHRDVVETACPGDSLYAVIPRIAANAGLRVYGH